MIWFLYFVAASTALAGLACLYIGLENAARAEDPSAWLRDRERRIAYWAARGEMYPADYVDLLDELAARRTTPAGRDGGRRSSVPSRPSSGTGDRPPTSTGSPRLHAPRPTFATRVARWFTGGGGRIR